jgi:hypothetical protein
MIWQTFIGYGILIASLLVLAATPYLSIRLYRWWRGLKWDRRHPEEDNGTL